MTLHSTKERFAHWGELLGQGKREALVASLEEAPSVEIAEFLGQHSLAVFRELFKDFKIETKAEIFEHLEEGDQLALYNVLPPNELALLFAHMDSDLRVDFYQKLTDDEKVSLLPFLSKDVRQDVITLSIYPQETAGGIMSTDFVALSLDLTVQEALAQVRKEAPSNKMIYYLYVVNAEMKMKGFVLLRDLVIADPSTPLKEILHDTFVYTEVREDREAVARKIEKYDLMALPVLNASEQLVGIVNYDDAMDVIRQEQTEDMERFMGIVPDESQEDYLAISSVKHFAKRIKWLVGLFFLSFLSSFIMHRFEAILMKFGMIALYLTTINDAGGNAGSQTATVVIRALSLGQVTLKGWLKVILKEAQVALMSATLLGVLSILKVTFFAKVVSRFFPEGFGIPGGDIFLFCAVVALALSIQVVVSTLIGATLPIFMKWLGQDPALAASPAITTIVDSTGLMLFLGLASYMLPA